eukprot:g4483.t1
MASLYYRQKEALDEKRRYLKILKEEADEMRYRNEIAACTFHPIIHDRVPSSLSKNSSSRELENHIQRQKIARSRRAAKKKLLEQPHYASTRGKPGTSSWNNSVILAEIATKNRLKLSTVSENSVPKNKFQLKKKKQQRVQLKRSKKAAEQPHKKTKEQTHRQVKVTKRKGKNEERIEKELTKKMHETKDIEKLVKWFTDEALLRQESALNEQKKILLAEFEERTSKWAMERKELLEKIEFLESEAKKKESREDISRLKNRTAHKLWKRDKRTPAKTLPEPFQSKKR